MLVRPNVSQSPHFCTRNNCSLSTVLIKVLGKPQPCQLCIAQKPLATPLSSWELHFLFDSENYWKSVLSHGTFQKYRPNK